MHRLQFDCHSVSITDTMFDIHRRWTRTAPSIWSHSITRTCSCLGHIQLPTRHDAQATAPLIIIIIFMVKKYQIHGGGRLFTIKIKNDCFYGGSVITLWLKTMTFMVGDIHLWKKVVTFMAGIKFIVNYHIHH